MTNGGVESGRGAHRRAAQAGFTLIELMVVVVVLLILGSIALPAYQRHALSGRLKQAVPTMMKLAEKERVYFNRFGKYYGSVSERHLEVKLGIDLSELGDFCFAVICTSNTLCETAMTDGSYPYGTPGNTAEFQVMAYLRRAGEYTGSNATCSVDKSVDATDGIVKAPSKSTPTGWVAETGAGSSGDYLVLSWPTPTDSATWMSGVNLSNAQAVN